jgi:two-component system chemotaxis response regulator CheB
VAVAASAGGLQALTELFAHLGADFPAAILVVQHLHGSFPSHLSAILERSCALAVTEATEGKRVKAGAIYVAPPNRHVVITSNGTLSLTDAPAEHHSRPSADVLFRSVAEHLRERAIAVVLTGGGSDGASGVIAVKGTGGTVIAQNEGTSRNFSMPHAAIDTGTVDFVLPLPEIAATLERLVDILHAA